MSSTTASEIERSSSETSLKKAISRLNDSGKRKKELIVPQKNMDKAKATMKKANVSGTIRNLSKTKQKRVK